MTTYRIACLDVWAPTVRELVTAQAPANFSLAFADTYDRQEQLGLAAEADFIVTGTAPVDAQMIAAGKRLKFIQKWGVGVDKIDVEAAARAGVPVAIAAGCNAAPVAELAVLLMLAVYRRLPRIDGKLRQGVWMRTEMRGVSRQVGGKTVGLQGFGNIARMVNQRLKGFGVEVLYNSRSRLDRAAEQELGVSYVSQDELLARSDIVSLHMPLTADTRNFINDMSIARMKDGAVLINTARGGLVDEDALYRALQSGKLDGAGLDVFGEEPPQPDHPLLQLGQVALTPHVGGGVIDNVANVARHCFGNIQTLIGGGQLAREDRVSFRGG